MANSEHYSIFKSGIGKWNEWREKNPEIKPDLSGIKLSHPLNVHIQYGSYTYGLMDQISDSEERKRCYQALQDGSLFDNPYWIEFWEALELRRINLRNVDLSHAGLVFVDFSGATLRRADLRGCDLQDTVLTDADLSEANIEGATLGNTKFTNTNLSHVTGLLSCRHVRPSPVDAATIFSSHELPEQFLHACGLSPLDIKIRQLSAPELKPNQTGDIAEDIRKLVAKPPEFASCFISYSTLDEEFAQKIHTDLCKSGVPCWFAPHDIRAGRKIYDQIDEAIRRHDRVLLVLSEQSMKSHWVNTEIARARRREVIENRKILFPVRLVPFEAIQKWELFDADIGKDSAKEVREYFIPDFSNWRDKVAYQNSFRRLVEDLSKNRQSA